MARRSLLLAILTLLWACAAHAARAQEPPPAKAPPRAVHFNLGKDGLALQGYDPLSYFPAGGGKPKKGLATITARHEGVLYRFASEETRKLFLATPARFEPEYGGWCAYAMADGEKVEIDPESFLVTDGRLYLFFKAWYADTRAKWRKNEERLRADADRAWKELTAPKPPPEGG